jgi:hypothetical protein
MSIGEQRPFVGAVYRANGGLSWEVTHQLGARRWRLVRMGDRPSQLQEIHRATGDLQPPSWRFVGRTAASALAAAG